MTPSPRCCLTVAGHDPCSFAGVTADLRTFSSLGLVGFSAITCLTAQTPTVFKTCQAVDTALLEEQIRQAWSFKGPFPFKIGLLASLDQVSLMAKLLEESDVPAVLDPIAAPSAAPRHVSVPFLEIVATLFPLVSLVTPNVPEAERILDASIVSEADLVNASEAIHQRYGCPVLLKGGHLKDSDHIVDVLSTGSNTLILSSQAAPTQSIHGSGCFLSASITAHLALGYSLPSAVRSAKSHISAAFAHPVDVGGFPLLYSSP